MIRLLARLTLNVLSNAVGLIAAAWLIDGFTINSIAFVTAVLIFSISTFVLGPLIVKIALSSASYLMGSISLITILVGLIITTLVSDGISISGINSWILATIVIWIFSVIGNIVLPLILFKKVLDKNKPKATE